MNPRIPLMLLLLSCASVIGTNEVWAQFRAPMRPSVPNSLREFAAAGSIDGGDYIGWAFGMGIAVLLFGVLVVAMWVYLKAKKAIDATTFFKLAGLTLVLTVGLALIVVGYSQDQIASMMGLLGTAAGYLLGHTKHGTERSRGDNGPATPTTA